MTSLVSISATIITNGIYIYIYINLFFFMCVLLPMHSAIAENWNVISRL